jgi:uncharacterized protein (DUF433 family)
MLLRGGIFNIRENLMPDLKYIVVDKNICHGQATFRGTRVMVWQVLEQVAQGIDWDVIAGEWSGSITHEAIAEAIVAASFIIAEHPEFVQGPLVAA